MVLTIPKLGAIRSVTNLPDSYCSNHRLQVLPGIKETACRQQLQEWFSRRREPVYNELTVKNSSIFKDDKVC